MATCIETKIGRAGEMENFEHERAVAWFRVDDDFQAVADQQARLALEHYCRIVREVDEIDVWPDEIWPQDVYVDVADDLIATAAKKAAALRGPSRS